MSSKKYLPELLLQFLHLAANIQSEFFDHSVKGPSIGDIEIDDFVEVPAAWQKVYTELAASQVSVSDKIKLASF